MAEFDLSPNQIRQKRVVDWSTTSIGVVFSYVNKPMDTKFDLTTKGLKS